MTPERLVQAMDAAGIAQIVNLGGWPPDRFEYFADAFAAKYPGRFIMFAKPDPDALMRENGVAEQLEWIKSAARMGARGLKENKSFGLGQQDAAGKLVTCRRSTARADLGPCGTTRHAGAHSHG